jgi:hypothetical protein
MVRVNKDITDLVLKVALDSVWKDWKDLQRGWNCSGLYDNQIEELKCLDGGENGAPGPTYFLDMSYNMIRKCLPLSKPTRAL